MIIDTSYQCEESFYRDCCIGYDEEGVSEPHLSGIHDHVHA